MFNLARFSASPPAKIDSHLIRKHPAATVLARPALFGMVLAALALACGRPPSAPPASGPSPTAASRPAAMAARAPTLAAGSSDVFDRELSLASFAKGNTHTHTLRSDGDSSPEDVVRWYRDHGYQFLFLTDHNRASARGELAALETERFRVLPGEEVSDYAHERTDPSTEWAPVHVNGLCLSRGVPGGNHERAGEALQSAVDAIVAQPGAIAQINHPNFYWALGLDDLRSIRSASLLEVANQHHGVRNAGDERHLATEALWDELLTDGAWLYGVASDDMHDLVSNPEGVPRRPGRGWVQVASEDLSEAAICRALSEGRFYFSTGVSLESIRVSGAEYSLRIRGGGDVRTTFIGRKGRVLSVQQGATPSYRLAGGEGYVRAKVEAADGSSAAWTQPERVQDP